MGDEQFVMSTFTDEDKVVDTLTAMKQSDRPWHRVYSPYPSHPILEAMDVVERLERMAGDGCCAGSCDST